MEGTGSNLIIRVKRRRGEDTPDTICVVDDSDLKKRPNVDALSGQFDDMRATEFGGSEDRAPPVKQARLLLRRVDTIESRVDIDSATLLSRKRRQAVSEPSGSSASNTMLIASSKKLLKAEKAGSIVLIDMTQIQLSQGPTSSTAASAAASAPSTESPTKVAIMNPITRKLAMALQSAFRTGDFNDVMAAVSSGANINYRQSDPNGGRTTLMCAVHYGNTRMVKQLLARGVDVLVQDTAGKTALDYAQHMDVPMHRLESKLEIQQWLYRAAVKQKAAQQSAAAEALAPGDAQEDFVYDIYCLPEGGALDAASPTGQSQVVQIDGIHIAADGQVQLVFDYESDWSDLADDEDVDSNDERFLGNDYPDEEEEEDSVRDEDDEEEINAFRRTRCDEEEYDWNLDSDGEGGQRSRPVITGRSVGRVLKVGFVGDGHKSKESLQQLWGESAAVAPTEDGADEEEEDDMGGGDVRQRDHRQRLSDMRGRTGMDFASDIREFDDDGLAKYGGELEDDADDVFAMDSVMMQTTELEGVMAQVRAASSLFRGSSPKAAAVGTSYERDGLSASAVAYDSELDKSDDDV